MEEKEFVEVQGIVTESLPNRMFRVKLDNEAIVLGILSGQMARHKIRVLLGDRVTLELPIIDLTKGRIIRRLS